jgi:hypothetical protein
MAGDCPAGGVHPAELVEGELGRLLCSLCINNGNTLGTHDNAVPASSAADAWGECLVFGELCGGTAGHEPPLAGAVPEFGCEGSEEVVGMEEIGEGGGREWVSEREGERVVSACGTMCNVSG